LAKILLTIVKTGFGVLELPNGISSHDALNAELGRLNPTRFAERFKAWLEEALPSLAGKHIAICSGLQTSDTFNPN
jgi:hypothetical protein